MQLVSYLNHWYSINKRDLPWRNTQNPYFIWVCEIIFQQTRINQGIEYYKNFIEEFPTVERLANAKEDTVLKAWEGLGYYSRARNLHFSAQYVVHELKGKFPTSYKELLQLKGVGKYTAAAIASICYNEKVPAIDGNAMRVYSRVFNYNGDISKTSTYNYFFDTILPYIPENAGDFNQAIMELGALICVPKNPKCGECPIQKYCKGYKNQTQNSLPVKKKKIKVSSENLNYYLLYSDESLLINQRTDNGIWKNLYELLPTPNKDTHYSKEKEIKHKLTHKELNISFYSSYEKDKTLKKMEKENNATLIKWENLDNFAFPKPIKMFLHQFYINFITFEETIIL